jgi:hypothetical protein
MTNTCIEGEFMSNAFMDGTIKKGHTLNAGVPDVRYLDVELDNFKAREVIVNGENVGEFHLDFRCLPPVEAVNYIQSKVSGEVSLIDPDDILKLEYNIYIKVSPDSMDFMMMGDTFNQMDTEVSEKGSQNG